MGCRRILNGTDSETHRHPLTFTFSLSPAPQRTEVRQDSVHQAKPGSGSWATAQLQYFGDFS